MDFVNLNDERQMDLCFSNRIISKQNEKRCHIGNTSHQLHVFSQVRLNSCHKLKTRVNQALKGRKTFIDMGHVRWNNEKNQTIHMIAIEKRWGR
jgi:hypothetical protein